MVLICEAVGGSDGVDEEGRHPVAAAAVARASESPRGSAGASDADASSGDDGRGGEGCGAELENPSDVERAVGVGGAWAAPPPPNTGSCLASLPDRVVSPPQSATQPSSPTTSRRTAVMAPALQPASHEARHGTVAETAAAAGGTPSWLD